jgi:DNA-binding NarL/FixJ family response regulator
MELQQSVAAQTQWQRPVYQKLNEKPVLILDGDELYLQSAHRSLRGSGFRDVTYLSDPISAIQAIQTRRYHTILCDIYYDDPSGSSFDIMRAIRAGGGDHVLIALGVEPTAELVFQAGLAGADDFLAKRPGLNLATELAAVVANKECGPTAGWRPENLRNMRLLHTLGLTPNEIETLISFACGFPRNKILAAEIGKSEPQLRKRFSRIYDKISGRSQIDSPAKLAHLLTACALYQS